MNRILMNMYNEMQVECPECEEKCSFENMKTHQCADYRERIKLIKEENRALKQLVQMQEQKINKLERI